MVHRFAHWWRGAALPTPQAAPPTPPGTAFRALPGEAAPRVAHFGAARGGVGRLPASQVSYAIFTDCRDHNMERRRADSLRAAREPAGGSRIEAGGGGPGCNAFLGFVEIGEKDKIENKVHFSICANRGMLGRAPHRPRTASRSGYTAGRCSRRTSS